MKETSRRNNLASQDVFLCPECGELLSDINTTESHANGVYEVRLKASHGRA